MERFFSISQITTTQPDLNSFGTSHRRDPGSPLTGLHCAPRGRPLRASGCRGGPRRPSGHKVCTPRRTRRRRGGCECAARALVAAGDDREEAVVADLDAVDVEHALGRGDEAEVDRVRDRPHLPAAGHLNTRGARGLSLRLGAERGGGGGRGGAASYYLLLGTEVRSSFLLPTPSYCLLPTNCSLLHRLPR